MAKSIARNAVKEYLETNTELLGKDLEKGTSIILVYLRLGMIGTGDVEFEKDKIKTIRKIHIKNNNVLLAGRGESPLLSFRARPNMIRMETQAEKLKRLVESR